MTSDNLSVSMAHPLDGLTVTISARFTMGFHVRLWCVTKLLHLAAWIGGGTCAVDIGPSTVSS